jgi:hopanoid-associated phosphorylase
MAKSTGPHLGVLAGLVSELQAFGAQPPGFKITTALSAARPELAAMRASHLSQAGCTHLLSFGLAGGLATGLAPGTVLLPKRIVDATSRLYPIDAAWHDRMLRLLQTVQPVTAPLVGMDEAVASLADKQRLRERTGAVAVDMESHHLGQAACSRNLPFLVLRVVVDTADHVLPPAATVGVRPDGKTDVFAVLKALVRQPGQLPDLISLGRAASKANAMLLRCARLGGDGSFGLL